MGKYLVLIRFQVIVATSIISISAIFGLPAISQEVEDTQEAIPVEAVEEEKEEAPPIEPVTTKNPKISSSKLQLLLKPLTQEKLEAEAEAWFLLLQEKAQEISDVEFQIATKESKEEIGGAVDTEKEKKVVLSNRLKTQQSALANNLATVLDALDEKGGDSTSYRQYIDAATGLEFNITDTGELALRFTTWLKSEEGGISLGLNLLKFGGVLIAAFIVAPRAGQFTDHALSRVNNISNLFRGFAVMIVKRGVLFLGGLLALAALGVNLGPVLAVLGGASFVLAFALQSNLGNFASGLMLLISKPFDVGDEVKVAGYWAFVDSISLASTKLKDFGGSIVTLPNNTVWGGDIINYTHSDTRKVALSISVKFSQDIDQVKKIWFDIVAANPKVLETPAPALFPWSAVYDGRLSIGLTAWTKTDEYWGAYVELLKAVQQQLEVHNIELAAPIQEIKLNQSDDAISTKQLEMEDSVVNL